MQLYVDGRRVDEDNFQIEYNNVTRINITCVVAGGHPEPVLDFIIDNNADVEHKSISADCRPQSTESAVNFLSNVTCSGTAEIQQYLIDYSTSGRAVGCTARSRGSPDVRLSVSFVPRLTGGMNTIALFPLSFSLFANSYSGALPY